MMMGDDIEGRAMAREVSTVERWFTDRRWRHTHRPYTANSVVRLRGTVQGTPLSNHTSKKLFALLDHNRTTGKFSHTFGCLDPVQVVQMAPHLSSIYVSGWQCSSTASSTNEPGPDFADYPSNTVPNKVDQLFRAQQFHDRKQREARSRMTEEERRARPAVDYLTPIVADGDTGHGGITAVMKTMKLMIEAGASGVHFEDQKPGTKKCGHMGGKVLVSVQEHVDRLVAARLQADICGTDTLIIARTDADSATLLDTNIDPRDHPFILGATTPGTQPLNDVVAAAIERGASADEIAAVQTRWLEQAHLMRFPEAVSAALRGDRARLQKWNERAYRVGGLAAMRALAREIVGEDVFFDWEAPRAREGYYRIKGGVDYGIMRGVAYAPYADNLWMETGKPGISQYKQFADGVHAVHPHQMLAYNLSPSFNWDAAGMSDEDIAAFNRQLGQIGVTWQFITLAGFHLNGLQVTRLARAYGRDGVIAYVNMIQRAEAKEGVDVIKHQQWSGTEVADLQLSTVTGGLSSTASMGHGVTESQFDTPRSKL